MCSGGIEMICGVVTDPVFGPVVMLGFGGIHAEILRDVSFRLAPFDANEALGMVNELRGAALLRGARGARPADVDALTHAVAALSAFAACHRHQISEIDINPLKVFEQGSGVLALDALVVPHERAHVIRDPASLP
jgi:acyl-CoA synthetase (NDP forming)